MNKIDIIIGISGLAIVAACTTGDIEEVSGPDAYASDCAACHGASGRGDGPLANTLTRTPPDLTMLRAQNDGIFPRDYIYATVDGFDRGSHFAPDMPAFGDGDLGPTIIVANDDGTATPVPARLLALADYLESIQTRP